MTTLFRVCLPVDDLEKAAGFYAYLFHVQGERVSPGMHCFRLGDSLLACYDPRADGQLPGAPHTTPLFIAVDESVDVLHQRVRTHGALNVEEKVRLLPTGERGFMLEDPAGNLIALVDARTRRWGAEATASPTASSPPGEEPIGLEKDFLNAVKSGSLGRVVEMLLLDEDLAKVRDAAGVSAILHALYKQHTRVASYLAERAGELDIWEACAMGDTRRVAELMNGNSGLVTTPAPDGFLPLGLACYFGHAPCVELLIARGADVDDESRNARRLRPIHSAVAHRDGGVALAIARRLLVAGADVNAVQQGGYTALHQAADRGDSSLVELLLQSGASMDAVSENGRTPLALARARNHAAIVKLLESRARR